MRFRYVIPMTVLLVVVMLPMPRGGQAQESDETCEQFVHRAIAELGTNCANMDRNTVCYGFEKLDSQFIQKPPKDTLAEPGSRATLTNLARVTMSPFDLKEKNKQTDKEKKDKSEWGIAVFDVNNNMIDLSAEGADEKRLIMLAIGDVEVENAVMPEFDDDGTLIVDEDHPAPMQELFLRNGYDKPECTEAVPPLLLLQSPEDTPVDVVINGTTIRLIDATIVVQVLAPGDAMRIMTFSGMAILNPDSLNEVLIPPGFYSTVCLDEPENLGLDRKKNDQISSCWSDPLPITQGDLDDLASLEDLPENILNYPIDLPEIIHPSGVGQPAAQFVFTDPDALQAAQEACQAGELSEQICKYLF